MSANEEEYVNKYSLVQYKDTVVQNKKERTEKKQKDSNTNFIRSGFFFKYD